MKILVLSHMYPSSFSQTKGIFVHQQVKELQRQGCDVRVISPVPQVPFPASWISKRWKAYSRIPVNTTFDGVEVHHPRYMSYPRNLFLGSSGKAMYSGIRSLVQQMFHDFEFDVIHAHVALPDGYAGIMLRRLYRKPVVVTIHGLDMQHTVHRSAACRAALRQVFEGADRIVSVCTKLMIIAEANFGFGEKQVVINNGINPYEVVGADAGLPRSLSDALLVLSVSHLDRYKGVHTNLRAISRLAPKYPNLRYLVIGSGPEERPLRQLASSLGLGERVEFLGEMPHEDVMRYMAMADIYSMPSSPEGFAMAYLEAMANGKPVIACRGEGITDIVHNGETGMLVVPRDVTTLVRAMDALLGAREKALAIGEKGRQAVLEKCTWANNARQYIELYGELSGRHG